MYVIIIIITTFI